MEKRILEFSWTGLWRVFLFSLLVALMFLTRDILLGVFLAIVISSGLDVPIDFLEKRGMPRTVGAILVFLLLALGLILIFYTIVPLAIVNLNTAVFNLQKATNGNIWWQSFFNVRTSRSINDLANRIVTQFLDTGGSPFGLFSQVLGGVSLAVAVFVISFYLSLSKHGVEHFIRAIVPADYEESAVKIYEHSRKKIGFWLRAQIILSFLMGLLVWISLSILGVKYAPLLGLTAGIFELIPFVGPILAGAISVLTAFSSSTLLATYTLVVFLILQQFESNILVPFLTRRTVGLHPVIVIVALLMGIEISGFLGAIIAVPAAAVFQEVIEDWAGRKKVHRLE